MAGRVSDWYFANGNTPDGIAEQIDDVSDVAAGHGPLASGSASTASSSPATPRREARDVLREIIDKADREAVEGFGSAVKQAGQSHRRQEGHVAGLRASRTWCSTTTASAPA